MLDLLYILHSRTAACTSHMHARLKCRIWNAQITMTWSDHMCQGADDRSLQKNIDVATKEALLACWLPERALN